MLWTTCEILASSLCVAKRNPRELGIPTPRMLAAARVLADMSQADLAAASGVNRTIIARYESGKTAMRSDLLARLVAALGAGGIHFIGDTSTPFMGVVVGSLPVALKPEAG